ncbi:hypothetical protein [Alloalcanivorax xenomutans]|uniref:hypothetical protein n=1 Tax=Alloalcanivorax xenomutans TaxID=1094342 RepID=UPI003C3A9CDE
MRRMTLLFLWLPLLAVLSAGCSEKTLEEQRQDLEEQKAEYQARIEALPDQDVKQTLASITDVMFWIREGDLERQVPPEEVQYSTSPYAILGDYKDTKDMADQLAAGVLLTHDPRYRPEEARLELPFAYPFDLKVNWEQVVLADGTELPVVERDPFTDQSNLIPVALWNTSYKRFTTQVKKHENLPIGQVPPPPSPIARARGEMILTVPETLPEVDFSASDVGDHQELSGWRITLEEVEGHRVRLLFKVPEDMALAEAEDRFNQIEVEASDSTGRLLSSSSTGKGPAGDDTLIIEMLDQLIDAAESGELKDKEAMEQRMQAQRKAMFEGVDRQLFVEVAFSGTVKQVKVLLPGLSGETTLIVPLDLTSVQFDVPDNQAEPRSFGVRARVYDHTASDWELDQPLEADPALLDELIQVEFKKGVNPGLSDPIADKLYFHFPEQMSNRLVSDFDRFDHVEELVFLDKDGEPVYRFDPEDRKGPVRFTVNRIEYHPDRFERPPVRARGELDVLLLPDIKVRWVAIDDLPEGYEMHGKQVLFGPAAADNHIPDLVLARDARGRYLKKIAEVRHSFDEGWPRRAYHFYDEPVGFLFIEKGPGSHASYSFDIPLQD